MNVQQDDAEVCGEVCMFESVKQNDRPNGVVYAASLMISLLAHATIICLLILIPLVFFHSLQAEELLSFVYLPPLPPPTPEPPRPPRPQAKSNIVHLSGDVAPLKIPEGIDLTAPAPEDIDTVSLVNQIGSIGNFGDSAGTGKGLEPILPASGPIKEPEAPRRPNKGRELIRVGSIEPSKLIRKVDPVYPDLAIRARISGDVRLEAVVDEEGHVTSLQVMSGHPFLVEAAKQAVLQWKYSPTILSGEPVAILAIITVSFHLK
jgi:periplasmic protein TonB